MEEEAKSDEAFVIQVYGSTEEMKCTKAHLLKEMEEVKVFAPHHLRHCLVMTNNLRTICCYSELELQQLNIEKEAGVVG